MGQVYRATDTNLKRSVAIKVLPAPLAADAERLARFQREAEVLASLNHPNIAAIYGLERSGATTALVMELVEGDDLSQRIAHLRTSGASTGQVGLPLDEALPIAKQIAAALEAAHEQGIIHRDLKPANIKVRADGIVKVLDFGLAKLAQTSGSGLETPAERTQAPTITTPAVMTATGMILGTAAYMSPEQARGKTIDKRTDVWAFGCVLYEMLTGRRAFEGEDVSETLATILKGTPDWAALPAGTPAMVTRLLRRCLTKDAGERIHDIADARLEIQDALASGGHEDIVQQHPRPRREPIAWALFSVSLAAAVSLAAWVYLRPLPPDALAYRSSLQLPTNATLVGSSANRFSLSPDGRRLAFVATTSQGGRPMLWMRPLNGLVAQPLSGTEEADAPFWSPDGRFIGFFSAGKIKKIDAAGGPSTTICEYPAGATAVGATWSRDEVILFSYAAGQAGVQRVAASGGTPVKATTPDQQGGERGHVRPFFLPDGRHFLYMAIGVPQSGAGPLRSLGIYVASLDSQERTLLIPDGEAPSYAPDYLLFLRGSTLMAQRLDLRQWQTTGAATSIAEQVDNGAGGGVGLNGAFTVSQTGALVYQVGSTEGPRRLVWVDRSGTRAGALGESGDYRDVELSPDGTRAATTVVDPTSQTPGIWLFDVARGVSSRLTAAGLGSSRPIWSPDGSRIAFSSRRGAAGSVSVKATSGAGDEEVLVTDDGINVPSSWSSDGRFLLYERRPARPTTDRSPELWVLPMVGEQKPFPAQPGTVRGTGGRFSPDGRWIAYTSTDTGRSEVYVVPFPGPGRIWRVSTAGGIFPQWRRDGREIFYLAPDGKLTVAPVIGRGSVFEIGVPRSLSDTLVRTTAGIAQLYSASADGERFLVNVAVEDARAMPLTLVVNWPADLRK